MTHFQSVPETGDAIMILTNSQRSWPLIACVLSDWAQWRAFPSVGMGKIIWGHYGLCAVMGVLISSSLVLILRLIVGYRQKRVVFRLLQTGTAVILLGVLVWSVFQEYLIVNSVFPILSVWLMITTLGFSITLLLSAWLPAHVGQINLMLDQFPGRGAAVHMRILVADDERDIRNLVKISLEKMDIRCWQRKT